MSERVQIWKIVSGARTKAVHIVRQRGGRSLLAALFALSIAAGAKAQLPDAPSASVIAPLKRFSLNVGLDNKYSLTTSQYDITPRLGVSIRLGERETVGFSYSHATVMNNYRHVENDSVLMWANFRVMSWGKIPQDR